MKLNYSKRILIIAILIFIGVLVLDLIFSNLLLGKINGINERVRQLAISATEREKNLKLKDSIINSEQDRLKLEQYFVGASDAETADFISRLESLAKASGLTSSIKSVSYEPINDLNSSETVSFIRFKFSLTGKWSNVFTFLQEIENLPKIVLVQNASFDVNSDLKNTVKIWSGDIDFSVVKLKN
jgi:Tfp pilus assembly protein PilO